MPVKGFKNLSIKEETWKKAKRFIEMYNKNVGYERFKSVAHLIEEALEYYYLKHMGYQFEHFNVYEDHVTIWDHRINRLIDVYIRDSKLVCEYCKDAGCEHVKFVLTIPKVIEALKKRGWIIKRGKVVYVPP
ncbi:hypothetical protein DRO58_02505 [Candidatus Bathyarchaeota archaeon]|nr:MAG: hypothetical protein DRO58_02505 [Candidatus Bathyarchaeota archaeon]